MTNPSYSRVKGATFEIDLQKNLRELGYDAERLRLTGKRDEGDIAIRHGGFTFLIEAKAEAKYDLAAYAREAELEAAHYAAARSLPDRLVIPLAVVKRRQKGVMDAYVVTTLRQHLDFLQEALA